MSVHSLKMLSQVCERVSSSMSSLACCVTEFVSLCVHTHSCAHCTAGGDDNSLLIIYGSPEPPALADVIGATDPFMPPLGVSVCVCVCVRVRQSSVECCTDQRCTITARCPALSQKFDISVQRARFHPSSEAVPTAPGGRRM